MKDGQTTFLSAEHEILGFDHGEIGADVCKSWEIPGTLTDAIRYHHYPSRSRGKLLAYIVHVGDHVAMISGITAGIDDVPYQMDHTATEFLGLREKDLERITANMSQFVTKITREILPGEP